MKLNLDKQSKSIISNIFTGKEYQSLCLMADEIIKDIKGSQIGFKNNQWELIQDTLLREGKAQGVGLFLKTIKQVADQYNEEKKGK